MTRLLPERLVRIIAAPLTVSVRLTGKEANGNIPGCRLAVPNPPQDFRFSLRRAWLAITALSYFSFGAS